MARENSLGVDLAPGDRGARLRRLLSKVRGLTLENGYQGRFVAGGHSARLRIDSGDCLRVLQEIEDPPAPRRALKENLYLPGNVRFAVAAGRTCLVADTRLDGELHLRASFREIGQGLRGALRPARRPGPAKAKAITPENVQKALDEAGWEEGAVVRLEDGWELRPRIHGEATPVRLAIEGQRLRVSRTVVGGCQGQNASAVAYQALCFNARLRHARLTWQGEAVKAETCLHAGLIHPAWLVPAARAVAAATHYTRTTLEILACQDSVSRQFEEMFLKAN